MTVVAIETATPACAAALLTSKGDVFVELVDAERHHTEALAPAIAGLLARAGIGARAVDRVVVDRGPGLFTGLRVGLATAIGFALGARADLVGVTSLELLAHGAYDAGVRGVLAAAVDARRGELFVQSFALGVGVEGLDAPAVTTPAAWVATWRDRPAPTVTGDGAARYGDLVKTWEGAVWFDQRVPPVRAALSLGVARAPLEVVTPLYLREPDAVANFATRERSP